jgi:hypothetical protein
MDTSIETTQPRNIQTDIEQIFDFGTLRLKKKLAAAELCELGHSMPTSLRALQTFTKETSDGLLRIRKRNRQPEPTVDFAAIATRAAKVIRCLVENQEKPLINDFGEAVIKGIILVAMEEGGVQ